MIARLLAAFALAAGLGSAAQAQDRGGPPGSFDFYVLALSWSPGFCALEGDSKSREQCAPGAGLGFVVHGLWPQNERGFPSECGPAGRTPSRLAMDEARGLFPSEGLARHQWRKHGTCSGLSPSDYFAATRKASEKVKLPVALTGRAEEQTWTPIDLERAFVAANPGLRVDQMSVICRRGQLQEVRVCLERDLRGFRSCPEVDRNGCRGGRLTVNAVR